VIDYLLRRPGQLVTKEELLNAVWPGTFIGEGVLKVAIRQIREALGDDSTSPRFIETAHRRGYRFIGSISESGQIPLKDQSRQSGSGSLLTATGVLQRVVARDEALFQMQSWLEKTLRGERQIVFVTGEAGIGKTSVVDTFTRRIAADRSIRIGRGQCLEQYGTSEAYLPVLEAIGRLCREERQLIDVLRAHAPMWLLQMPSLVSASDRESLSRDVFGATRERMLREMGGTLDVLTADLPLVLILEDLHWSDYSTLDLISYLASQRQAARLMLIGTYRPVELIVSGHPLKAVKRELLAKQQCEELPLEYLNTEAVGQYLSVKFPANRFPGKLAELIHERTEGNPLFMVNAVDFLVAEGAIAEHQEGWELVVAIENVEVGVPDSIKQMIEKQVDHLDADDQRLLESASVAGAEFSTLSVVAGLGEDRALVEARCDALARQRQFIQDGGIQILPSGEVASRYGFIHALYQNVLYERVSASRRVQLHRRIGEAGEALYGERAGEIAAELAMHFERASDHRKAAKYLQQAAENDLRRFAYPEAVGLARRGLALLGRLADTPERDRQELSLHLTLGVPLIATEGYAAPEVGRAYTRARQLCERLRETPEISHVLWGLWAFHTLRAEMRTAREIADEFLQLAGRRPYSDLAMRGHLAMGVTLTNLGEFAPAIEHFEKALLLYDPDQQVDSFRYTQPPGSAMRCHAAWSLWFLGQPDQALRLMQEALAVARELSEPHGLAHAFFFASILHQLRGEAATAQEHAEAAIVVSKEHKLVMYQAMTTITRGWSLAQQGRQEEGIEQMRQGLAAIQATGTEVQRPLFLAQLAYALGKAGQPEEAFHQLEEALAIADRTGERFYEAELYRLKGELLLMQSRRRAAAQAAGRGKSVSTTESSMVAQAEHCFNQSIKMAQQQNAKSLELRAVTSIARLYQNQGKRAEARSLLEHIYVKFTEGFDTRDLREAKVLLDELT